MYITDITSQTRRDIRINIKCGSCGHQELGVSGYDDTNFHVNVIPSMKCEKCGKTAKENKLGEEPIMSTKYKSSEVV